MPRVPGCARSRSWAEGWTWRISAADKDELLEVAALWLSAVKAQVIAAGQLLVSKGEVLRRSN